MMVLGNTTAVRSGTAHGGSDEGVTADRLARLVRDLGDRSFARRETASRDLAAIGEPARVALTQATTDPDPEVARRARAVLDGLTARAHAAAAKKELDRWQGEWTGNGGQRLVFQGDRRMWGDGGPSAFDEGPARRVVIVAVGEKAVQADLVIGDPAEGGVPGNFPPGRRHPPILRDVRPGPPDRVPPYGYQRLRPLEAVEKIAVL